VRMRCFAGFQPNDFPPPPTNNSVKALITRPTLDASAALSSGSGPVASPGGVARLVIWTGELGISSLS